MANGKKLVTTFVASFHVYQRNGQMIHAYVSSSYARCTGLRKGIFITKCKRSEFLVAQSPLPAMKDWLHRPRINSKIGNSCNLSVTTTLYNVRMWWVVMQVDDVQEGGRFLVPRAPLSTWSFVWRRCLHGCFGQLICAGVIDRWTTRHDTPRARRLERDNFCSEFRHWQSTNWHMWRNFS